VLVAVGGKAKEKAVFEVEELESGGKDNTLERFPGGQKTVGGWVVRNTSSSWQSELCSRSRLEPTISLTEHSALAFTPLYGIAHTSKRSRPSPRSRR
jgi:hypothetical protein